MSTLPLSDSHERQVSYLRFSVTDRCNLHCLYCRGEGQEEFIPHADVLRYEEILRLVRIAGGLGIVKVRLTGGEPFARKGIDKLLLGLRESFPDFNLRITSNGTLMRRFIPVVRQARIDAVNLSIDSFNPETFKRVTGHDMLGEVMDVLHLLLESGIRVKVNAVAMRGVNDQDMPSFLKVIRDFPIDLRFIEFMPMGSETLWSRGRFWGADEILAEAAKYAGLAPVERTRADRGPARMFEVEGSQGRLGVISALSNHFCSTCNRLRITSDGQLRTCLFSDRMYPLKGLLRDPEKTDQDIACAIRGALAEKPVGADILKERRGTAVACGKMDSIGG